MVFRKSYEHWLQVFETKILKQFKKVQFFLSTIYWHLIECGTQRKVSISNNEGVTKTIYALVAVLGLLDQFSRKVFILIGISGTFISNVFSIVAGISALLIESRIKPSVLMNSVNPIGSLLFAYKPEWRITHIFHRRQQQWEIYNYYVSDFNQFPSF